MISQTDAIPERIWSKLKLADSGCWEWQGSLSPDGYGLTTFGRKVRTSVHRAVYQAMRGPIPDNLVCDHLCRNRRCANPDHIEPVTNAENLRRGEGGLVVRAIAAANAAKTHCKRGHPLSGDNLRLPYRGNRMCRTCAYELDNARRRAKRRQAAALSASGGEG